MVRRLLVLFTAGLIGLMLLPAGASAAPTGPITFLRAKLAGNGSALLADISVKCPTPASMHSKFFLVQFTQTRANNTVLATDANLLDRDSITCDGVRRSYTFVAGAGESATSPGFDPAALFGAFTRAKVYATAQLGDCHQDDICVATAQKAQLLPVTDPATLIGGGVGSNATIAASAPRQAAGAVAALKVTMSCAKGQSVSFSQALLSQRQGGVDVAGFLYGSPDRYGLPVLPAGLKHCDGYAHAFTIRVVPGSRPWNKGPLFAQIELSLGGCGFCVPVVRSWQEVNLV
jgi:hypothetical protein